MKYLLITMFVTGCALPQSKRYVDKKELVKSCVIDLLNEDVDSVKAAKICDMIYRRKRR